MTSQNQNLAPLPTFRGIFYLGFWPFFNAWIGQQMNYLLSKGRSYENL